MQIFALEHFQKRVKRCASKDEGRFKKRDRLKLQLSYKCDQVIFTEGYAFIFSHFQDAYGQHVENASNLNLDLSVCK